MPTGYTAVIGDGISFEDFVMRCARAFGACITMRDDPTDKEISEFKPSPCYKESLDKAKRDLSKVKNTTLEEAEKRAQQKYEKETKDKEEGIQKNIELRSKYQTMLVKVRGWEPPSPDHQELKDFMIKQITNSIEFDCSNEYWLNQKLKLLTGQEWKEQKINRLFKDIIYYNSEWEKEKERVAGRNAWIKALRESLK